MDKIFYAIGPLHTCLSRCNNF